MKLTKAGQDGQAKLHRLERVSAILQCFVVAVVCSTYISSENEVVIGLESLAADDPGEEATEDTNRCEH